MHTSTLPDAWTTPRTVVQVFSSDHYDPWDPEPKALSEPNSMEMPGPPHPQPAPTGRPCQDERGQGMDPAKSKGPFKGTNKMPELNRASPQHGASPLEGSRDCTEVDDRPK